MNVVVDLSDRRTSFRWGRFAAFWALPATLFGLVVWRQEGVPLSGALKHSFVDFYVLGALTIGVAAVARRIGTLGSTASRAMSHLVLAAGTIVIWKGTLALYLRTLIGPAYWRIVFEPSLLYQISNAVLVYAVVLSAILVWQARLKEEENVRREAELTITAREAQLRALQAHLQPHFVFNALTAALALIETDPPRARVLVEKLSEVLRQAFARLERKRIPLSDEIAFIESCLAVEQIRFGERLRVVIDAPPDARAIEVPPLILQPLVENAVKHGIAPRPDGGTITLTARVDGSRLRVTIRNPVPAGPTGNSGVIGRGLEMTRQRLDAAFPREHTFEAGLRDGMFVAEIQAPAESDES